MSLESQSNTGSTPLLHLREFHDDEHVIRHQTVPCRHLHREEVRGSKHLPVQLQELCPAHARLPPLRSGVNKVPTQDIPHRHLVDLMPQIRQCTLDPSITRKVKKLEHGFMAWVTRQASPNLQLAYGALHPAYSTLIEGGTGGSERHMDWKTLLAYITGTVDQELLLRNEYLVTENRILRNQLKGRLRLSDGERPALAEIGQKLGKKALAEVAKIVKPDTILGWHRQLMTQKFDGSTQRKAPGRPQIDPELEALVVRMARENRSWGYDRIVGALANLGYTISDQTVGNILKRHGIPPAPERRKTMTWREFIRIHMDMLGATDFFSSEIWPWCRFVIPTLLSFIRPHCRKIHVASLTSYLNAWWMLAWLPWSLDLHASMGSWVGLVKEAMRSRRVLCGEGILRQPLSASIFYDHQ